MRRKVALLLFMMVFAFAPIAAIVSTCAVPTVGVLSLAEAVANRATFGIQTFGDPVDDPTGPG
ncbi:MAG: hypothetical protein PVF15_02340 [Candidatus Bathyarchaeota archaeon]